MPADHRCLALGGTADKQLVGIGGPAQRFRDPSDPFFGIDTAEYTLCGCNVCPARRRPYW
jgi:hypothetical protein